MVVLAALILPFTALGRYFGFTAPPGEFFAIVALLAIAYLGIVELTKRVFYARLAHRSA